eukprot:TRINITY_DN13471_c0_g1_i1.p2 TRINITY_DN13471_c0_g1~~TRINITY_DN13471_c0_g1_i1.p2  ORF type:complete len:58 (-),score=0.84 TRINITY_DN13471_c0_g1_i1:49-222(-)
MDAYHNIFHFYSLWGVCVSRIPGTSDVQDRMVYATTRGSFRRQLEGLQKFNRNYRRG